MSLSQEIVVKMSLSKEMVDLLETYDERLLININRQELYDELLKYVPKFFYLCDIMILLCISSTALLPQPVQAQQD